MTAHPDGTLERAEQTVAVTSDYGESLNSNYGAFCRVVSTLFTNMVAANEPDDPDGWKRFQRMLNPGTLHPNDLESAARWLRGYQRRASAGWFRKIIGH